MYAIVRIGGKQYRAEAGKTIIVEKLPLAVGEKLEIDQVLMYSDGEHTQIGQPLVESMKVTAQVDQQFKGKKIIVFKYRFKKHYRRKQGHRQNYTRLTIDKIGGGSSGEEPPKKTRASRKKSAASSDSQPRSND